MKRLLFFLLVFSSAFPSVKYQDLKKGYFVETIPQKWEIRWHLARALTYANRINEAIFEYEKLIKEKNIYEAKIELFNILITQNDLEKALKLAKTIPIKKFDRPSRLLLAKTYFQINKYRQAEKIFRKYIIDYPNDLAARFQLGSFYMFLEKYDEALMQYRAILFNEPKNAEAKKNYDLATILKGLK